MSARLARIVATTALTAILSACGSTEYLIPPQVPTLAPPSPAGMEELPPAPPSTPDPSANDCDPTASLRPFTNKVESDLAVARIRARGRLIVGLDIGSNLLSFRDPITGDITGFDVDIAGEVARDIFGTPSKVEYRILASADRITALQTNTVDIVVKTMTVTCERRELVNFSTVYFNGYQRILAPRESDIYQASDLSGKRVCVARGTTSLERVQQITPQPVIVSVVTWADCLVALQQREVDAISTDDASRRPVENRSAASTAVSPTMSTGPRGEASTSCRSSLARSTFHSTPPVAGS